jgi:hypothetical protein
VSFSKSHQEIDMEEQSVICAARLRERAVQCRDLARGATSVGIAQELEAIAEEYEDDAERLETVRGGHALELR